MAERQHHGEADARHHHNAGRSEHNAIVTDPVCGMKVDSRTAPHRLELKGTPYFFCSSRCLEKFKADPAHYLNPWAMEPSFTHPAMGALPQAAEGTIWTCPMHPEIRRNGPGSCPICGTRWRRIGGGCCC